MPRLTATDITKFKSQAHRFAMVTAYDYTSAQLCEQAGIPILLVGDSLGMVVLGHDSTVPVTMDDMTRHTQMVSRGSLSSHIVADLPFMTYQISHSQALTNAAHLIQSGGAQSIKIEGGESICDSLRHLVTNGIPVMGHLGLTPQYIHTIGGFRVQGKTKQTATKLLNDALAIEKAGAYALVLELIPTELSAIITSKLSIPTIGIGAGPHCDGQVQVFHDLLGLFSDFKPKHTKQYCNLAETAKDSLALYAEEVVNGIFPDASHSFSMEINEMPEN